MLERVSTVGFFLFTCGQISCAPQPLARGGGSMKIGGKSVLEDIEQRHWERFAADAHLGAPFVRTRIGQLCKAIISAIDSEFANALPSDADFSAVKMLVRERAVTLKEKA